MHTHNQAQQAEKAAAQPSNGNGNGAKRQSVEEGRRQGEAFRRVDDQYWGQQIKDDRLKDNSCA